MIKSYRSGNSEGHVLEYKVVLLWNKETEEFEYIKSAGFLMFLETPDENSIPQSDEKTYTESQTTPSTLTLIVEMVIIFGNWQKNTIMTETCGRKSMSITKRQLEIAHR